jgi:hypothetical protein
MGVGAGVSRLVDGPQQLAEKGLGLSHQSNLHRSARGCRDAVAGAPRDSCPLPLRCFPASHEVSVMLCVTDCLPDCPPSPPSLPATIHRSFQKYLPACTLSPTVRAPSSPLFPPAQLPNSRTTCCGTVWQVQYFGRYGP